MGLPAAFTELSLFSGAGGGLLATRWLLGWRTACYVELDAYCADVLKARIRDGVLDDAPIWDDARTFDGPPWRGCVDIVTAGFPCTPWSTAGQQRGAGDPRNLWPDTVRVIGEVQPRWVFLENVPALLGRHGYFGQVLRDLAEGGYDARWRVLSAAEVGAPHKRDRLWVVAHADGGGRQGARAQPEGEAGRALRPDFIREGFGGGALLPTPIAADGAHAPTKSLARFVETGSRFGRKLLPTPTASRRSGLQSHGRNALLGLLSPEFHEWMMGWPQSWTALDPLPASGFEAWLEAIRQGTLWSGEPPAPLVAPRTIPHRVQRLAASGNGWVPAQAAAAWRLLAEGH